LQTSHRGCGNLAALEVTPLPPNRINALDCLQFANRMLPERAPLGCEPLTDMIVPAPVELLTPDGFAKNISLGKSVYIAMEKEQYCPDISISHRGGLSSSLR
ncbi:hypothetical protein KCV07_g170, partial [Aureobasidium melanogenum]